MHKVERNETYWTYFDYPDGRKLYEELKAKDVFNAIVEGAWKNGEPGLLFYDRINDSPYKYSHQIIDATNPCGEQPLPYHGSCNLGSIDVGKFVVDGIIDWNSLRFAVKLGVDFLDRVLDVNKWPTEEIEEWAKNNRPVGLGVMGLADYFMKLKVAYGSKESLELTEGLFSFMKKEAEEESERLGEVYGVPNACKALPVPRRNITCLTVAPTGSIAILAGCNSGIEPIFSEVTKREDKTGKYIIKHPEHEKEYFRCAVSSNGSTEVTWQEHILIQDAVQKYVDSGVSKTCNFPNHTRRETIAHAYMYAWSLGNIKGLTVYRNGSRDVEVLSPKNLKKDKCPVCDSDLIQESGCKKCSDPMCGWSVCEIA
jgi:ribonucleoside-diphosphate reductase alpha chain